MFREYPPKSTVDTRWAKLTIWPTSVWHFFLLAKFRDCVGVVHYIVRAMASQITSLTIVYSTVYSGSDQRKRQSSASLAFVRGIHRWPVTMNGDRWIPRIKGQYCGKSFHLMTSSCCAASGQFLRKAAPGSTGSDILREKLASGGMQGRMMTPKPERTGLTICFGGRTMHSLFCRRYFQMQFSFMNLVF